MPCNLLLYTDTLHPPTNVSVIVTAADTAVVAWDAQQSRMCDVVVGNYSVRYQLTNDTGSPSNTVSITMYTSSTNITLNALVPNVAYNVSVATIASGGRGMSAFSAAASFTVTATAAPPGKSL